MERPKPALSLNIFIDGAFIFWGETPQPTPLVFILTTPPIINHAIEASISAQTNSVESCREAAKSLMPRRHEGR